MLVSNNHRSNFSISYGNKLIDYNQTIEYCHIVIGGNISNWNPGPTDGLIFHFYAHGILLNIIGIFGIVGNTISTMILSRPEMKLSINYLLLAQVIWDTVTIISHMLFNGIPSIYWATGYLFTYNFRIHPFIALPVYPIIMISQTISEYLTVAITLERFIAVCQPLRARSICTCGRARLCIIAVLIFSVLYNIPRFWEWFIQRCMHPHLNIILYSVQPSDLRKNIVYVNLYINWMNLVFISGLPFVVLVYFNLRIYLQVRKANKERQKLSKRQKKEIRLAIMLLYDVVIFCICSSITLASNFLEVFKFKKIRPLNQAGNLVVTINSSINFIIYMMFGERFRIVFFKLFYPPGLRFVGSMSGQKDSLEPIPS